LIKTQKAEIFGNYTPWKPVCQGMSFLFPKEKTNCIEFFLGLWNYEEIINNERDENQNDSP
jgi:hypothetical protein